MNGKKAKILRRFALGSTVGEKMREYVKIPKTPSAKTIRDRINHYALRKGEWTEQIIKDVEKASILVVLDVKCTRALYQHLKRENIV